jgi:hypothetical protein
LIKQFPIRLQFHLIDLALLHHATLFEQRHLQLHILLLQFPYLAKFLKDEFILLLLHLQLI